MTLEQQLDAALREMLDANDALKAELGVQKAEVARLQNETDRQRQEITDLLAFIEGDKDSLSVLQSLYLSPTASESMKLKAAAASIAYEKPKPASTMFRVDIAAEINAGRAKYLKLVEQGTPPPPIECKTNAITDWTRENKPDKARWTDPALASDNAGEAAEGPDAA
jgi:hypothetical protein